MQETSEGTGSLVAGGQGRSAGEVLGSAEALAAFCLIGALLLAIASVL